MDKGDGTYGIKYNVYGYDRGMLEELRDFLLEGEIREGEMKKGNKVIAVANVDGQGNYNFYGYHPGDSITVRVPRERNCPPEALRFDGERSDYVEKEFEIAAIVSWC